MIKAFQCVLKALWEEKGKVIRDGRSGEWLHHKWQNGAGKMVRKGKGGYWEGRKTLTKFIGSVADGQERESHRRAPAADSDAPTGGVRQKWNGDFQKFSSYSERMQADVVIVIYNSDDGNITQLSADRHWEAWSLSDLPLRYDKNYK